MNQAKDHPLGSVYSNTCKWIFKCEIIVISIISIKNELSDLMYSWFNICVYIVTRKKRDRWSHVQSSRNLGNNIRKNQYLKKTNPNNTKICKFKRKLQFRKEVYNDKI